MSPKTPSPSDQTARQAGLAGVIAIAHIRFSCLAFQRISSGLLITGRHALLLRGACFFLRAHRGDKKHAEDQGNQ
jgi:hypothetical protein